MKFAVSGYDAETVKSMLTAPCRAVRFRFELLDRNLQYKRDLRTVESASIEFDSTQSIMRTARFSMRDDNVDFLNARIRPVMGLGIPKTSTWLEWPLGVFVLSSPARTPSAVRLQKRRSIRLTRH
jgi:hypothetical protein